jgi:anti-anti-sigma factor
MKVKDQLDGEVVVIQFSGKVMASDELTSFHGRVHYYLDLHKNRFVIDMEHVVWMNSAGLGALIAAYSSVARTGGRFALANITNIQNLLNITQLVRVFDTFDTRHEALRAVAA